MKYEEVLSKLEEVTPRINMKEWVLYRTDEDSGTITYSVENSHASVATIYDKKLEATHIALCSPQNILVLIDTIKRMQKALEAIDPSALNEIEGDEK